MKMVRFSMENVDFGTLRENYRKNGTINRGSNLSKGSLDYLTCQGSLSNQSSIFDIEEKEEGGEKGGRGKAEEGEGREEGEEEEELSREEDKFVSYFEDFERKVIRKSKGRESIWLKIVGLQKIIGIWGDNDNLVFESKKYGRLYLTSEMDLDHKRILEFKWEGNFPQPPALVFQCLLDRHIIGLLFNWKNWSIKEKVVRKGDKRTVFRVETEGADFSSQKCRFGFWKSIFVENKYLWMVDMGGGGEREEEEEEEEGEEGEEEEEEEEGEKGRRGEVMGGVKVGGVGEGSMVRLFYRVNYKEEIALVLARFGVVERFKRFLEKMEKVLG